MADGRLPTAPAPVAGVVARGMRGDPTVHIKKEPGYGLHPAYPSPAWGGVWSPKFLLSGSSACRQQFEDKDATFVTYQCY